MWRAEPLPVKKLGTPSLTTGAFSPALDDTLRALDVQSRIRGADDYTQYGLARSSPRTFYAHHAAAISMTIVLAEAIIIRNAASAMMFSLTNGLTP